jgi:Putative bacterial sensory transduction regulator
MRCATLLAVGLVVLESAVASAGPLPPGGVTADEVALVMKARGLPATVGKDGVGDPNITSKFNGLNFEVIFYDCAGARCKAIQFSRGFDTDEGVTLEKLNEWNRDFRFGRAFRDNENDPYVQMDVDVELGATIESVGSNLQTWLDVMEAFAQTLGWGGDVEKPEV